MDQTQNAQLSRRPRWAIEDCLDRLIGQDVRVAVESFSPVRWDGEHLPGLIRVRDLYLPDNRQPGTLPVFFEGQLRQFERRIAVVYASLEAPTAPERSVEGVVHYRGTAAVILRGPALVRLAFPFQVERLPAEADGYWADLKLPTTPLQRPQGSSLPGDGIEPRVGEIHVLK